jgi:uncharacterized protein (DUF2252 family)
MAKTTRQPKSTDDEPTQAGKTARSSQETQVRVGEEAEVAREAASEATYRAMGRAVRKAVPRTSLGAWTPPEDRQDPIATLKAQNEDRVADLVPLRFGRMSVSPFSFYRGAAAIMARDLATRPRTTLRVQLAGDAHLANFGGFATPERQMIFDLNDFDETLPGPFEWDVQRLVASFVVAGRHRGFTASECAGLVERVAMSYSNAMTSFAGRGRLDVWYARIEADDILRRWGSSVDPARVEAFQKRLDKARGRTSRRAVSRYTAVRPDGELRIVSQPPVLVPLSELVDQQAVNIRELGTQVLEAYRQTLSDDRRMLLSGYRVVDIARKVVGVGSVGTRCWIVLMVAVDDEGDDLVLQVKEAGPSVLEAISAPSDYPQHGQRVVEGQRLMQAASDPLLGWTSVVGLDGVSRDYYVRQMWDWKTSADLETMDRTLMDVYAHLCGWTLARAHARTGDRKVLAAYLGTGRTFTTAMQEFAESYADQNQRDYEALKAAIADGSVPVESEPAT